MGSRNVGELNITQLMFADDTLILLWGKPISPLYLCCLFLCFEVVSCLKINLAKSEWSLLAMLVIYKIDVIIEKIERRLASWKRLYLSKGSRITLI